MLDYKKIVLDWLYNDYIKKNVYDISIDIHIDQLLPNIKKNNEKLLSEGLKLFNSLVLIIKENNLSEFFIPTFRISLKDIESIQKIEVNSIEEIIKDISKRPPEICLFNRFKINNNYVFEEYHYSLINNFLTEYINKENYYFYYSFFKDKEDIEDNWEYHRMVHIEYNENKIINVDTFKDCSFDNANLKKIKYENLK